MMRVYVNGYTFSCNVCTFLTNWGEITLKHASVALSFNQNCPSERLNNKLTNKDEENVAVLNLLLKH